jgi:hypothetical protein
MVVAVVMAVDEEAIKVVVEANLLQTLAELTSVLLLMPSLLRRARSTLRRDSVSNATRRDTDSFSAPNLREKQQWECHSLRSNDGGMAVLPANWSSRLHLLFVLREC